MNKIIWLITMAASIAALVWLAGQGGNLTHMAVAAGASIIFAILAVLEDRKLRNTDASDKAIAATNAWNMALVWAWGAINLVLTYTLQIGWHEWLTFFLAFAVVALLSFGMWKLLSDEVKSGNDDDTVLKIARYLTIGQVVGMIITMVGLYIDGKMERYINPRQGWEDWAANNYFFFGALALAIISANALYTMKQSSSEQDS